MIYNNKVVKSVLGFSQENTGFTPEEMCADLTKNPSKASYYSVPYAGEYGPIAFRDSMDQLRWLESYLKGNQMDYIVELEDGEFIPLTSEVEDAIRD